MREAMAGADVGDDVLDGDPTLASLQQRVADLLGVEAALWTPTGCMANAIALMDHLERGDRFLAPAGAHVLEAELGTSAWLAGGLPAPLPHSGGPGRPTPADVTAAAGTAGPYFGLRTRLLCLENTHNAAGGAVTPVAEHRALVAAAHDAGLAVHLDGARLWHAAVALGVPPSDLTAGADTVSVCLSKGLGAPMGSLVAGSAAFVERAWRLRKMLGGGIRQGGVLGAAGHVALDGIDDLAADHEHARLLAEGLAAKGWPVSTPETNIVLVTTSDPAAVVAKLAKVDVRAVPFGPGVRFVTHRDVSRADVEGALERIGGLGP
ncbi:aminotransferase class I/II-fold pyridoxal phosphate-dependent enzyme [Actinomycetospora endophytica]|uniref:Aminotransferase class I/II-fold pyridoxal phosphate-dependent enzyme n=1 Tax=Actinomycetospora endophytica TaxID=2291215 RepID=A0ABS8P472_9PSEU|nr:GntG family PLP-dependent aldolase [Actinomycetospora endophytica]MCD2192904.1 aminotransferase class I/II-fold pyridoxal phosphate-dependent enzyme [Actinomycetospora endophytica]